MKVMKIPSKYKIWRFPLLLKIKYFFKSITHRDKACITYWINANTFIWDTKIKHYNWGDYINLNFAELISGKTIIPSRYYTFAPKVAMIGSILPWAMDRDTIVWGSGCLDSQDPLWQTVEKPKKVCAVRGPLTRNILLQKGIDCPEVYGDPVLLFPKYYSPFIVSNSKIGIIPHASTMPRLQELLPETILKSNKIVIINPENFKTWHDIIDSILSCKIIFSSSLHGLIIADAYSVPNVWISFKNEKYLDNYFKFHDYLMSVGKGNINNPIMIDDIDFDDIQSYIKSWKQPEIDIDKLLAVCPLM